MARREFFALGKKKEVLSVLSQLGIGLLYIYDHLHPLSTFRPRLFFKNRTKIIERTVEVLLRKVKINTVTPVMSFAGDCGRRLFGLWFESSKNTTR